MRLKNKPYINTLFNKILYSSMMFIGNALLTRALGVGLKGTYTWLINLVSIISIFSGLGIYQSIPYFYRNNNNKENVKQSYLNIFLFQSTLYLFILLILNFIEPSRNLILISGLLILETLSQQLNMLVLVDNLYARNKIFIRGAFINLLGSSICFVLFKDNLYIAVLVTMSYKLFYIIAYIHVLNITPNIINISIKDILMKIKFGYLPMLSFLMITLNYKVDIIMLEASSFISKEQLSYYSAGVSIAELAWFIPDVFKDVLFSKTARESNFEEIATIIRISNVVISCMIIGVILFGKFAITLFYGNDFTNSFYITVILFLGIPSMSWFKIIYTLFNAFGKRKTSFLILFISTIINIVLNYALIPIYGINGSGIASVFSYSICGLLFLYLFSKMSKIPLKKMFFIKISDFNILFK